MEPCQTGPIYIRKGRELPCTFTSKKKKTPELTNSDNACTHNIIYLFGIWIHNAIVYMDI
jgi:hypothetical protein